ncbi:hypothetical protein BJ546DRAFT_353795 [Cryomyces antarcticus]|uniref:Roadblock/LAMTOR2 domain-containing protein n=1 Tax=Cryomyces antarcticus TaxID=329879 RepID=A0ABR0M5B8_9PEZI|nr:hypothetical protein LTR04_001190 [Oleoguttula sp. CCFEE 6159]KAK5283025.1 hypothetical protein LTR16_005591 [Cryomyces antarcticus]
MELYFNTIDGAQATSFSVTRREATTDEPQGQKRKKANGRDLPSRIEALSKPVVMLNAMKLGELLSRNVDPKLFPRMFIISPNGDLLAYSTPADVKELRDQAALISMAWKDHAAMLEAAQYKAAAAAAAEDDATLDPPSRTLETLIIEFDNNNLIVRAVQPNLLLILVGGVPPHRKKDFKMTPEAHGDARYPSAELPSPTPDVDADAKTADTATTTTATAKPPSSPSPQEVSPPKSHQASATDSARPPPPQHQLAGSPASQRGSDLSVHERDFTLGLLHIQRKKIDRMAAYIRAELADGGFVMPDDSLDPAF